MGNLRARIDFHCGLAGIRAALRERLADPYEPARSEAVWGLAQRKNPDGLRLLLERLEAETWQSGDEMAAAEILNVGYDTPVEKVCDGLRALIG